MTDMEFLKNLTDIVGEGNVLLDEPMSKHTTFKVGGKTKYMVEPTSVAVLCEALDFLKFDSPYPYFVLGNGSNLLVTDNGYEGVMVKIGKNLSRIEMVDDTIKAEAGAMLSKVARLACDNGYTGMEGLSGIPGSIGGGVAMNAGAYGDEVKDTILSATVYDPGTGSILELSKDEMDLSYRHSIFSVKEYVILDATFKCSMGDKEEIQKKVEEYTLQRKTKQPLEYGSAGSTFKRPEGYFAGKLIQDAGLRGYTVGGAQVSEKHCGVVINKDNATATDVLQVIRDVQNIVKEKFGVSLETEVCIVDRD